MITSVLTGNINVASRASQDWNLSLDYTEADVFGGAITIYTRWVYFQSFERQLLGNSGVVDELDHPDVASLELMRNRLNFGGEWADKRNAFGIDAEYFGTRQLPEFQWVQQQSHNIAPYFQVDAFGKTDLTRFLPGKITLPAEPAAAGEQCVLRALSQIYRRSVRLGAGGIRRLARTGLFDFGDGNLLAEHSGLGRSGCRSP